jgi:hypothetical protein
MSDPTTPTEPGLEKALACLKSVLIEGETLEAWGTQRRWFALTHRRTLVAATSGRFIGLTRGFFGGFEPVDIRWQDLKEARIRVGVLSATLSVEVYNMSDLAMASTGGRLLTFTGLRKSQAQEIYRLCQGHEQAWREKRRVRELEELRAKSGGFQLSGGAPPGLAAGDGSAPSDSVRRLQQAKEMRDAKLISDSEYESIKAKIINSV